MAAQAEIGGVKVLLEAAPHSLRAVSEEVVVVVEPHPVEDLVLQAQQAVLAQAGLLEVAAPLLVSEEAEVSVDRPRAVAAVAAEERHQLLEALELCLEAVAAEVEAETQMAQTAVPVEGLFTGTSKGVAWD